MINLPEYPLKVRASGSGNEEVYDPFRRQWVVKTPEEWVRQQFLTWLVVEKNYPAGLIAVEKGIKINGRMRRFDALIFNKNGEATVLLEFKAPTVVLNNGVVEQIAAYNSGVSAMFLIISNGLKHYCVQMNYHNKTFALLSEIPDYNKLSLHLPA